MPKIYATLDQDLNPYEIGTEFWDYLHWQLVTTDEESTLLGAPVGEYAAVENTITTAALSVYSTDDLNRLRITVIDLPDAPEGQHLSYTLVTDADHIITANTTLTDIPVTIPEVVSRMQLKRQLLAVRATNGLGGTMLDQINSAIESAGDPDLSVYWAETSEFHRSHPRVIALAEAMGIDSSVVDQLFLAASKLT